MDPLEVALRPVANLLNRNIRATTPAREICRALAGTTIAVRVRDTALAAYFHVHEDALELAIDSDDEPDVLISGSLLTLARMAGAPGTEALRQGSLDISGDVQLAGDFQKLLALAKPDLEEELSAIVGDVAAHRLGELARGARRWSREARATMGANIREYLQEESRDVPSRYEVDRFGDAVGKLRDDVDRLAARINRLQGDS